MLICLNCLHKVYWLGMSVFLQLQPEGKRSALLLPPCPRAGRGFCKVTEAGEGAHPAPVAHTLSCCLSSSYACLLWRVCPDLQCWEYRRGSTESRSVLTTECGWWSRRTCSLACCPRGNVPSRPRLLSLKDIFRPFSWVRQDSQQPVFTSLLLWGTGPSQVLCHSANTVGILKGTYVCLSCVHFLCYSMCICVPVCMWDQRLTWGRGSLLLPYGS